MQALFAPDHPTLGEIYNGKFRPYIDSDMVECEVDKVINVAELPPQDAKVMLLSNIIRYEFWYGGNSGFTVPIPPTKATRPLNKPYNIASSLFDENLNQLVRHTAYWPWPAAEFDHFSITEPGRFPGATRQSPQATER